jgi:hypothetical protein
VLGLPVFMDEPHMIGLVGTIVKSFDQAAPRLLAL